MEGREASRPGRGRSEGRPSAGGREVIRPDRSPRRRGRPRGRNRRPGWGSREAEPTRGPSPGAHGSAARSGRALEDHRTVATLDGGPLAAKAVPEGRKAEEPPAVRDPLRHPGREGRSEQPEPEGLTEAERFGGRRAGGLSGSVFPLPRSIRALPFRLDERSAPKRRGRMRRRAASGSSRRRCVTSPSTGTGAPGSRTSRTRSASPRARCSSTSGRRRGCSSRRTRRAVRLLPAWLDAPEDVVDRGFWATLDWWLQRAEEFVATRPGAAPGRDDRPRTTPARGCADRSTASCGARTPTARSSSWSSGWSAASCATTWTRRCSPRCSTGSAERFQDALVSEDLDPGLDPSSTRAPRHADQGVRRGPARGDRLAPRGLRWASPPRSSGPSILRRRAPPLVPAARHRERGPGRAVASRFVAGETLAEAMARRPRARHRRRLVDARACWARTSRRPRRPSRAREAYLSELAARGRRPEPRRAWSRSSSRSSGSTSRSRRAGPRSSRSSPRASARTRG